ncbi:Zinc finger protein MAGPIE [Heracleum sosnowskyi]|uniref:Zinc finger protein MAGPIE n=1 Tax=Heracleum sosnowskyi TaxID=360622 RepID=A0AAD8IL91_9APIA|nr:Zinc finger protein MAGPIE [Heracleum sosnowskyi]
MYVTGPDAEIVALSPRTLMATNRFWCDVCEKGFQREQNLHFHRREHNLPWKLKRRTSHEIRKKVYICPEQDCVHHDPSRALGDLTGIKKHFLRKHGEKKFCCNKCNKMYAVVFSDWKARDKICGTKEYICECGTTFSRRDNLPITIHFVMHLLKRWQVTQQIATPAAAWLLAFSQMLVTMVP